VKSMNGMHSEMMRCEWNRASWNLGVCVASGAKIGQGEGKEEARILW